MRKLLLLVFSFFCIISISNAQTTAKDFNKEDCNGNMRHLFADLDSGNAVVLFYFMSNCATCPPPAQKIQEMANNVMKTYPGKVKAYAIPYNNSTKCSYTATWVTTNNLPLFTPLDSGASHVAYYGGFGMPTVVLLGGKDHKVLFSTLSFSTSDTTTMRNEILQLFGAATSVQPLQKNASTFNIYPNPASNNVSVNIDLNEAAEVLVDVADITGKQVAVILNGKVKGKTSHQFNTNLLPNGIYFVRLQANGKTSTQKISVIH